MKRLATAAMATGIAVAVIGCGSSKDEQACRAAYKSQQVALNRTPSDSEIRRACDRDGNSAYARSYYGSRKGSSFRGGGSGSGK